MNLSSWQIGLLVGSALGIIGYAKPMGAQVIPDNTLPVGERSQVSGNPNFQIDGGAQRGTSLFHSFSQFSVPTEGSASFNNAVDVQNIFSRVTGNSASNIDGLLRANGTANLFFLNPNGILFGPNASLDIGGSFVATTANAIGFPNGEVFSSDVTQPLPSQLLTVEPNALFFNQIPQPIINHSTFNDSGLQVPLKQNLLLVGGPVELDDGRLASPGSYVDIGSVGGVGTIGLVTTLEDWQLTFPDSVARADVSLINNSRITLLADEGGSAAIAARNVTLSDESRIRVGIDGGSGFVGAQAGSIQIDATESVNLLNNATARIEVLGTGNVGDMTITTGSLVLEGNSRLIAATSGQGNVGSVIINARDAVSFNDSYVLGIVQNGAIGNTGGIAITTGALIFAEGSRLDFSTRGQGNAGSVIINADTVSFNNSYVLGAVTNDAVGNTGGIAITTGALALAEGAQLFFSTEGQGNAGSVTINARDRVSIDGENPTGDYASTIFTQVKPGATGEAGNVTITTGSLFLTNGGAVNTANTGGTGNAGRVTINARDSVQIRGTAPILTDNRSGVFTSATEGAMGSGGDVFITTGSLSVADQGRIITNAEGVGDAGKIEIQANGPVSFDGGDAISTLESTGVGRGGDIDITGQTVLATNGAQLSTSTAGQGDSGDLTITANTLSIQDRAEATVSSSSTGRAGSLSINANQIFLSQGKIRADTTGGGGNIDLRSPLILLRNNSGITTNATGRDIPGGNIALDTQSLVAVPDEDSDISANSESFRGGNVNVNALATFGIQPRPSPAPLSDITATGASSDLNGAIAITTPRTDPTSGLTKLPTNLADASQQIARGCPANQGNSFVTSGRGGLPPTPEQQLDDDAGWQDRRRLTAEQRSQNSSQPSAKITPQQLSKPEASLTEATGWQIAASGDIQLVAASSNPAAPHLPDWPVACQGNQ